VGGVTMIIKKFLETVLSIIITSLILVIFLISFVVSVIATVLILILAIPVVFAAALFKLFICKNNFLKNKKIISNICERIQFDFLEERSDI